LEDAMWDVIGVIGIIAAVAFIVSLYFI